MCGEQQPPIVGPLATVTHARLRAGQGDFAGARRILEEVLAGRPDDAEALRLLESLAPPASGAHAAAAAPRRPAAPDPSPAAVLRRWLECLAPAAGAADGDNEMMLDDALSRIQEVVEGVEAVFVVGMDGMIVAGAPGSDASAWEWIVASYAGVMKKLADANREGNLDPPHELVVGSDKAVLVFRQVTAEYGLLAALDPDAGALGRTRFELRKAAVNLAPELAA
jgi:predicted regulator of Ras-like GTPase activity (Roadblock/LC7/MglB family)